MNSTKNRLSELEPHFKLWFSLKNGEGIFGEGKWLLLKTIDEEGSLSKAAIKLKISYRKAWGDIKKMEQLLNITILDTLRGGNEGGSSKLTSEGKKILEFYSGFHENFKQLAIQTFEKYIKDLKSL